MQLGNGTEQLDCRFAVEAGSYLSLAEAIKRKRKSLCHLLQILHFLLTCAAHPILILCEARTRRSHLLSPGNAEPSVGDAQLVWLSAAHHACKGFLASCDR